MSPLALTIIVSVVAVGLFALGLSLTLIFKGHHIESEIGDNPNMKKLGIKCAAQQMRDEERALRGDTSCDGLSECSPAGCGSCSSAHDEK